MQWEDVDEEYSFSFVFKGESPFVYSIVSPLELALVLVCLDENNSYSFVFKGGE